MLAKHIIQLDDFNLGVASKLQAIKPTLDMGIFVDQRFLDRLNLTGIDANKFIRYTLKTIDLRFNEPQIISIINNERINFRIVYYEVIKSALWESLNGVLNAKNALEKAKVYSLYSSNRSIYDWDYSLFLTG